MLTTKIWWNIAAPFVLFLLADHANAQSLWQRRHPDRIFLVADTAARQVGDLVTVIIRETTDVENRDQRALGKDSDSSFEFDVSSSGNSSSSSGSFDISGNSNREFNGSSQYSVEQDFADKITVPVVEVLPNGHLVIAGRRQRLVAGEVRSLIISGVVRPIDIGPNNSVQSQYIANFKICYEGDGSETHFTNQGWSARILNKIWPF
jgi:flagellar L-ring protein precursor FlgH